MEAKASAKTRYNDTGVGAGPNDFDFLVNVDRPIDAKEIARHEMNHYTDYLISRNRIQLLTIICLNNQKVL